MNGPTAEPPAQRPGPPPNAHREPWGTRLSEAFARRLATYRDRSVAWRLLVPAVFLLAGALFVTSSVNSDGTDLRAGRYGDLGSLVEHEKDETDELLAEANALSAEVAALTAQIRGTDVQEAQTRAETLRGPAGMLPVRGPGLTVTLDDAPEDIMASTSTDEGELVVHQQDIQAVANALWAGGAEAMTIQGQRVISTTGIKCVGNTVVLHGIPYSPPYVISAVGDPEAMLTSLNEDPYIAIYKQYAESPDHQLGWDVTVDAAMELPGFGGSPDLTYARPAGRIDGPVDGEL